MRKKFKELVEKYRLKHGPYASDEGESVGIFLIPYKSSSLKVLVGDGSLDGWEHVSVSLPNRCPNWPEMCFIKDLFWGEEECVIQYHPQKSEYVNNHPHCLHLWRPISKEIPKPPSIAVGVQDLIITSSGDVQ